MYKEYRYTYTNLAPGESLIITAEQMGVSRPDGYYVLAIRYFSSGAHGVVVRAILSENTGTGTFLGLQNVSSSVSGGTAVVQILYGKNISRVD